MSFSTIVQAAAVYSVKYILLSACRSLILVRTGCRFPFYRFIGVFLDDTNRRLETGMQYCPRSIEIVAI